MMSITALHYTKQCTGIVQYQKVPVCIPIQYPVSQKVSYYMYCSSPVRFLPPTKQFPTTLLCCSSSPSRFYSPSLNPSPLFLFLSLYLLF